MLDNGPVLHSWMKMELGLDHDIELAPSLLGY